MSPGVRPDILGKRKIKEGVGRRKDQQIPHLFFSSILLYIHSSESPKMPDICYVALTRGLTADSAYLVQIESHARKPRLLSH